MTVQFILGRSGSGKTHFCLEQIRNDLLAQKDGKPLIFLVPDQATFQMEQALLADGTLQGFHRAHILSFARLARTLLQEVGSPSLPVLSESAKQMILARLLQEHQPNLKIFHRLARRMGFVEQISRMIRELRQYRKTPDDLQQQQIRLSDSADPTALILADQLADLTLIYQAYLDTIASRFVDPDDFLDLLALTAPHSSWLRGAKFWLDGFAGFTPQQYHALAAIIDVVELTQISLCLDPADGQMLIAEKNIDPAALDPMNLFSPTFQTYQKLFHFLHREELKIIPPLLLPRHGVEKESLPRYSHTTLANLELRLAQQNRSASHSSPASASARQKTSEIPSSESLPDQGFLLVEAPTRRKEVEAAAQHILRLCREKHYRFRDIAVIFRDLSDYTDLIQAVFSDYQIPCFLDQPRPIRHHPLAELLRSAMDIILTGFQNEPIFHYVKTNLTEMEDEAIDALENYVVSRGITPPRWLDPDPWHTPKYTSSSGSILKEEESAQDDMSPLFINVDSYRRQAITPILHLMQTLYSEGYDRNKLIPVETIASAITSLLEENQVPQRLAQWHEQASRQGDLDTAQTHAEAYTRIIELLDEIVEIFAGKPLTLESFAEILNTSLSSLQLGLIPPSLDQVLVGSIERSRHPPIRAALLLGINEGKFPHVAGADSLISDDHRAALQQNGLELAPPRSRQLLQEHYLAYIAVTRAHECLWISYPVSDERGRLLQPSSIIDRIRTLSPDIPLCVLPEDSRITPDSITTVSQLGRALAWELSALRYGNPVPPVWAGLYHWANNQHSLKNQVYTHLAGIRCQNRAALDSAIVQRLFDNDLHSSISRLESFAACPFQYFCRHILDITPRQPLQLAPVDVGGFYHQALHLLFLQMQNENRSWQTTSNETLEQYLTEITGKILQSADLQEKLRDNPRRQYHMFRARDQLIRFCRALKQLSHVGLFTQTDAEAEFGPHCKIPALIVPLDSKSRLILHGRIDRVDTCSNSSGTLAFCVMDYKTSLQKFDYARFYHGLSLQLPGYLEVMRSHFRTLYPNVTPAAALYIPIRNEPGSKSVDPGSDLDRWLSNSLPVLEKPRGIIAGDSFSLLQQEKIQGYSPWYSVYVGKDGSVFNGSSSDVVTDSQRNAILQHTRRLFLQLAGRILHGDIDVKPARLGDSTPCSYCPYSSVCRFDFSIDEYQFLEHLSKEDVLEKLTKSQSPAESGTG